MRQSLRQAASVRQRNRQVDLGVGRMRSQAGTAGQHLNRLEPFAYPALHLSQFGEHLKAGGLRLAGLLQRYLSFRQLALLFERQRLLESGIAWRLRRGNKRCHRQQQGSEAQRSEYMAQDISVYSEGAGLPQRITGRNQAWVPHISLVFREMWVYRQAWG